MAKYFCWLKAY